MIAAGLVVIIVSALGFLIWSILKLCGDLDDADERECGVRRS